MELTEQIRADMRTFQSAHNCDRLVMVWCASTEIYMEEGPSHLNLESFEAALDANDETIAPSMLYAYAALMEGIPFANGTPNLTADIPALVKLAIDQGVPICGKDCKTGRPLIKPGLAPILKRALLAAH